MVKRQVTGRFFRVFFNQGRSYHFAAVESSKEMSHRDIPKSGYIENWKSIPFKKRSDEGELADFLSSDICDRLCSPKLKQVIDQNLTRNDISIQWLPVTIAKEESGETFEYFYLHFPEVCDSLDEEETVFDKWGGVMRPCYALAKIKDKNIFNSKGFIKTSILVSKDLRKAILDASCTGLKFEQTIVLEEYDEENLKSDKIVNL